MKKLPTQLNTNGGLGHTINTNFQILEENYGNLKVAFAGLNFIQMYGDIPYKNKEISCPYGESHPLNSQMNFTGKALDYDSFPSTAPGSAFLATTNIVDEFGELSGLEYRQIPIGTFIVSTNNGWRSYNPVYTTQIYRPKSLECTSYEGGVYAMKYNYETVPVGFEGEEADIVTNYIETTQSIRIEAEKRKEITQVCSLSHPLPDSGVNVRLIDTEGESSLITYKRITPQSIEVTFFATVPGEYFICIDYGIRPQYMAG